MKMSDIKTKARAWRIKVMATATRPDLIRKIQEAEGNFDCFKTAQGYCDQ